MSTLSIVTTQTGAASIVTLRGRVDSQTAPQLDEALAPLAAGNNSRIVVDLGSVEYMSSAGMRSIVKAAQAAQKGGGALKMAAVPQAIQSVLYTVGLNQIVGAYASADEAVSSF